MKNKIFKITDENKFAREVLPKQSGIYLVKGTIKLDDTHRSPSYETNLVILTASLGWGHSLVICSQGAFFDDVMVWSFEDGAITEDKLASQSVTTAKIKDGAVTKEKLAPGVIDGGGGGVIVLDMPLTKTQLPDDIALQLFGSLTDTTVLKTTKIFYHSPSGSGLLAFSDARVYTSTGSGGEYMGISFSRVNELSTGSMLNSFIFYFTSEEGHIYTEGVEEKQDLFKLIGESAPTYDTFVTYDITLRPGTSKEITKLSKYPYFIKGLRGVYALVTYLTTAQVEALTAKVAEQFSITNPNSKNLRNAYIKLATTGGKNFVEGDDISNIAAVIYGTKIYIF